MAASTKSRQIGIIAEEINDVEVLAELTSKFIRRNAYSISRFVGHGCGKLRRKLAAWATVLRDRGCEILVVLHDSDGADQGVLRAELDASLRRSAAQFDAIIVLIPVEELESWLLCDPDALRLTFNMKKAPKLPARPENQKSPKEFLRDLVNNASNAEYANTIHNLRIAQRLSISALEKCPSFGRYPAALKPLFGRSSHV